MQPVGRARPAARRDAAERARVRRSRRPSSSRHAFAPARRRRHSGGHATATRTRPPTRLSTAGHRARRRRAWSSRSARGGDERRVGGGSSRAQRRGRRRLGGHGAAFGDDVVRPSTATGGSILNCAALSRLRADPHLGGRCTGAAIGRIQDGAEHAAPVAQRDGAWRSSGRSMASASTAIAGARATTRLGGRSEVSPPHPTGGRARPTAEARRCASARADHGPRARLWRAIRGLATAAARDGRDLAIWSQRHLAPRPARPRGGQGSSRAATREDDDIGDSASTQVSDARSRPPPPRRSSGARAERLLGRRGLATTKPDPLALAKYAAARRVARSSGGRS